MNKANFRKAEIIVPHRDGEWRAQAIEDEAGSWIWTSEVAELSAYLNAFAQGYHPSYSPDEFDSMIKAAAAEIGAQILISPVSRLDLFPDNSNLVY